MMNFAASIIILGFLCARARGFIVNRNTNNYHIKIQHNNEVKLYSTDTTVEEVTASDSTADVVIDIDPKDAVKIFGRLAEKYIMLDESGGMCCYSACTDCEFRLPGGGYRMADQSASRPKWIPTYDERSFSGQNKEHISKWKTALFSCDESGVTKAEFVESLVQLDFATPLGGPFLSKSAGSKMDDTSTVAVEYLFDVLTEGKTETLTYRKMSHRLKVLSKNEEGLTWPNFSAALGIN